MRFVYFILFAFVMSPMVIQANEDLYDCCDWSLDITEPMCHYPTVEAKIGYFLFADSKMRRVFDKGGLDLQLCGTYPLWRCFDIYASVEYLEKKGRSLGGHQRTSIWAVPLSLGLKMTVASCSCLRSYFTIGPRYFFMHLHNHSEFVKRNLHRYGMGGFVNIGLEYDLCDCFLLDVFAEASYKRMKFHHEKKHTYTRTRQVGGYTFGAGLTYSY